MAWNYHVYLLELMILGLFLTDTSGATDVHMIVSDGENVTLSCNKTLSDCTSTSWIYYKESPSNAVILFDENLKMIDHERLSLGPKCSLNIYNVTKEDAGFYICRPQMEKSSSTDANVYLHVLQVSPLSEMEPGSSVTLSCHVYSYDNYFCKSLFIIEGMQLMWINGAGVNLQSDSRYQISSSTEHCNSSLTTTLLNEDNNRELRCQITTGTSKVETSAVYTVRNLGNSHIIKNEIGSIIRVIIFIVEVAVLTAPTVILLLIICERRSGKRRAQSTRLSYVNCSESVVINDC